MNRPYVICHILSSLDGKINGPFMAAQAAGDLAGEYGKIRAELNADAWLYGTTTVKEFLNFREPVLDENSQVPEWSAGAPVGFDLEAVERVGRGGLHLRYLAQNAKRAP